MLFMAFAFFLVKPHLPKAKTFPDKTEMVAVPQIPAVYAQAPRLFTEADSLEFAEDSPPVTDGETDPNSNDGGIWALLRDYGATILMGFMALMEVIARLTPSEKDNSFISWLTNFINTFLPNKKAGGGLHI